MTEPTVGLPSPHAVRVRQPSWRDPRLGVGLLLVLLAVVLTARVVAAADDTVPVYAAAHPLTTGDAVRPADVRVSHVRLDDAERYLSAAGAAPTDLVVLRAVGEGELLARSGLGDATLLGVKPVGIPVDGVLPARLVKGALVDVWVSMPDLDRAGAFLEPDRLAEAAEVAEVTQSGGALGAGGSATVQVLLAEDPLRAALSALAAQAEVALVLVPAAAGEAG